MTSQTRFTFHLPLPAFALAMLVVPTMLAPAPALAQTITVLHNFTGGADGSYPAAGVTFDQQGRIYGTASAGGRYDYGVVYRLVHEGEGWILSPIYSFGAQDHDGIQPYARVVFGPDGLLYGATNLGGAHDFGTLFSLRPPATACTAALCPWLETILYSFTGGVDGGYPQFGDLAFDQAGNIYGTTSNGGSSNDGVVFKLTRSGSGWTESVLWNFNGSDGGGPYAGVIFDNAGNLYGTTTFGGSNRVGTVYELSPTQSGWSETTLYSFTNDINGNAYGGLIMDAHGDLFGITGGSLPGAAYELTPQNGSWSFTLLQTFHGEFGAMASPTFDSQGNLYGPLSNDGSDDLGEIFQLTPSGNQWLYTPYYQFGSSGAGVEPTGAVIFDASGNMYGTAFDLGGGEGTVWEITP
jgi:uncharacterized repeat protein (TIGR03803 family)